MVIERRITLEGGEVIIDGGGDGTVVRIKADGSIIRGVKIVNSGGSHDQLDSGLLLEANDVLIENNVIENVLSASICAGLTITEFWATASARGEIRSVCAERGCGSGTAATI